MNTKVLIYIILSKKIDRNSRYIEYTRLFRILEKYDMILHSDKTISFKNYTILISFSTISWLIIREKFLSAKD